MNKRKAATYGQDIMRGEWGGGKMTNNAGLTYNAGNAKGDVDETSLKILEAGNGTSIFDPVLCELLYCWFCPPGGVVIDPFAGGSVRGIVASRLCRQYIGVELRNEQVEANRQQENIACEPLPVWHCGDSRNIDKICEGLEADFVFSCPPYVDLERYSDDPQDISTMKYTEFVEVYSEIIKKACGLLKNDRFACFVVGEVRDRKGNYYGFIPDTINAFKEAGLSYYNEAILVTSVGSLPIRCGRAFESARKLGKTHQNVLIFCKGSPKTATAAIGDVQYEINIVHEGGVIPTPALHESESVAL